MGFVMFKVFFLGFLKSSGLCKDFLGGLNFVMGISWMFSRVVLSFFFQARNQGKKIKKSP